MEKLVHGIHKFHANFFRPHRELYRRLALGQNPETLFITCSDSRMVPDLITQSDPGDLFVLRNVGNIVPPHGTGGAEAAAAAIEYAVKALKVKDIVVCGHTKCGAVHGMLHPDELADLPSVRSWVCTADTCAEIVRSQYPGLDPTATWKVAVEENVLVQLENLRTHPAVQDGLAAGSLKLHGWVYKIETGDVFAYAPGPGQYVPLVAVGGVEPSSHPRFTAGATVPVGV